ncbi:phosphoribosyltransferase family protein [Parapedobacter sp. 2B3]|uniref:phosphoribosyltransferase family protein n=1 Tax=Parapedobacter sp. 2B3 TaxID=3342381 RepID=UPI0035B690DA
MAHRFSLHKIYQKENCPFNKSEYSRFKFGDTFYAKKFAEELFQEFITEYGSLLLEQTEIILFPSPYSAIPTASNFLCSYFKENLNRFLYNNGKKACIESKIYRNQTYVQDYGNMDFEQRMNLIANDTYYIDKHFVDGKFCLFIDDIKITGSHEKTVNKILAQFDVSGTFVFIYYAELMSSDIHPNIENHYNYFAIQTVDKLIEVLNGAFFQFNTRIVKYILLMDNADFDRMLHHISSVQLTKLLNLAISNNYHRIEEYQYNITKINHKLWQSTYKKGREKISMLQNLLLD